MWHNCSRMSSALIIALALAPQVLALAPRTPFSSILVSRQTTGTACASQCAVFNNAISGCSTVGCLCNNSVANGLQSCVNCAVSAGTSTDVVTTAHDLVNTYQSACSGVSLPPITVPSGGGGSGVSTSKPVAVPSTSKASGGTTLNVITTTSTFVPNIPSTTKVIIQSDTSTAVVITSVTAPISSNTPIVQSTIRPSAVTGPVNGPAGPAQSTTVVQSGAIGKSGPAFAILGLHLAVGGILGTLLAV